MNNITNNDLYSFEKSSIQKLEKSSNKGDVLKEVVNDLSKFTLDSFQKKEVFFLFKNLIKKLSSSDIDDEIINKIEAITKDLSDSIPISNEKKAMEEDIVICRVSSLLIKGNQYRQLPNRKYNIFLNYKNGDGYFLFKSKYLVDGKSVLLGEGHIKKAKLALDFERNKYVAALIAKWEINDKRIQARLRNENQYKSNFSKQNPDLFPSVYCSFFAPSKPGKEKFVSIEDLSSSLKKVLPSLTLKERLTAFRSIIECISALHKMGYIHRDIKLENLLGHRNTDGDFVVKSTDFEFTIPIQEGANKYRGNGAGTNTCFSPERWTPNSIITTKDDVWATGITLLDLFGIKPSWMDKHRDVDVKKIVQSLEQHWLDHLCYFHPIAQTGLWPILKKMLEIDPSKRAEMDEIKTTLLEQITPEEEEKIVKILELSSDQCLPLSEFDEEVTKLVANVNGFEEEVLLDSGDEQKAISKKRKEKCSEEGNSKKPELNQGPRKRRKVNRPLA